MTNGVIHGQALEKQPTLNLSGRIPELDGLRGVAIGLVLLCHFFFLVIQVRPGSAAAYLLTIGRLTWSGVDLFFVLSGFLIGGILLDARDSSNYFRVFYTRRFFRIVPIYVVLLASVGITFHLWRAGFIGKFEKIFLAPLPWPTFAVFVQNFAMVKRNDVGVFPLGVTWSLAVEEQFYLTLPLVVRFLDRRALLRFILIGVAAAPLLRAFFFYRDPTNVFSWYTLMPCRADSLLLGVLGAIALRDPGWRAWLLGHRRFMSLALMFFLVGVALLGWRSPNLDRPLMAIVGLTWLALTYLSFLLYALLFPESWMSRCLRWGWLRGLGVIAYGTYLFHEFFLSLFFRRLPWISSWRDLGVSVLVLAFTLLFCRLSWLYFEKPLVKLGHRTSYNFDSKQSNTAVAPLATEGN